MPKLIIKWNDASVFKGTKEDIESRMGNVAQFLRNEVIKSINTSQRTRTTTSGARVGLDPSRPGDPPKRVEGDLVKSITAEVKVEDTKVIGRYGSTQTKKAIGLEFGTSKMAARPFIRPPLFKNRGEVKRMLIG